MKVGIQLGLDENTIAASAVLLLSISGTFLYNRNESVLKIAPWIWYSLKHKRNEFITFSHKMLYFIYGLAVSLDVPRRYESAKNIMYFGSKNKYEPLTKEEIDSIRKLIKASAGADQRSALFNTFKEIHDIELIIKQIPKLAITVDELLVDVKKLEENIENVQDAIHSHISPDSKKTIFSEYKNVLKNHNERLLALQHRVEQYIKDDQDVWFLFPAENETISSGSGRTTKQTSFAHELRATPSPFKNIKNVEQINIDRHDALKGKIQNVSSVGDHMDSPYTIKKNISFDDELHSINMVNSGILNTKIDTILQSPINEAS